MKTIKLFFMMLCVMASTLGFSKTENKKSKPWPFIFVLHFPGEIGIKSENCEKIGLSCLGFPTIGIQPVMKNTPVKPGYTEITLVMQNEKEMQFVISSKNESYQPICFVDNDILLPPNVCREFGFASITLLKGGYPVKNNNDGTYTIPIRINSK